MRYLDLFAGMGGFHQAAVRVFDELGITGILAGAADISDISKTFYRNNYLAGTNMDIDHDIRDFLRVDVGPVDIIFAGFPCQPFSHAGTQEGFDHDSGNAFDSLMKVIRRYKPKYILLENVANLKNHDGGNTWKIIHRKLSKYYNIPDEPILISPTQLGLPEHRKRVYIPGILKTENIFLNKRQFESFTTRTRSLESFLVDEPIGPLSRVLSMENDVYLTAWDELLNEIDDADNIVRPAWGMYWNNKSINPDYPEWKKVIVRKNKMFYKNNRAIIDAWMRRFEFADWKDSFKKFEWNVKGAGYKTVFDGIIQFRPSGIRVKKYDVLPTMVALNQTPYLGPHRRFISPSEVAAVQGYRNVNFNGLNKSSAYKLLGNNVNVHTTSYILKRLIEIGSENEN